MKKADLVELGAVLIGSRAFGVASESSDWDYAVCLEKVNDILPDSTFSMKEYFQYVPPMGNNLVALKWKLEDAIVDVLVYEKQSDVDTLKKIVAELSVIPTYIMSEKYLRILLFEKAMSVHGFTEADTIRV